MIKKKLNWYLYIGPVIILFGLLMTAAGKYIASKNPTPVTKCTEWEELDLNQPENEAFKKTGIVNSVKRRICYTIE